MRTATARDLRNRFASSLLAWLRRGDGHPRAGVEDWGGLFEPGARPASKVDRRALFASRFGPLVSAPKRDFSRVLDENRGDA
jgi:hypothetical protein